MQLLANLLEGNLKGKGTFPLPSGDNITGAPTSVTDRLKAITQVDLSENTIGFEAQGAEVCPDLGSCSPWQRAWQSLISTRCEALRHPRLNQKSHHEAHQSARLTQTLPRLSLHHRRHHCVPGVHRLDLTQSVWLRKTHR